MNMKNAIFTAQTLSLIGDGGYQILTDLTCDLEEGGTVILGHNGAGKTSFLKVLAGLVNPSSGSVVLGKEFSSQDIAFVFQKPILLNRTVQQNIDFIVRVRRNKGQGFLADELLERLGLSQKKQHPAARLSGGERQKLALIMALMLNPKILVLDEPTANIDLKTESEIESLLFDLKEEKGVNIVLTTHIISQAKRLADSVVYMHEGMVSEVTEGSEFFKMPVSDPARKYINSFLG